MSTVITYPPARWGIKRENDDVFMYECVWGSNARCLTTTKKLCQSQAPNEENVVLRKNEMKHGNGDSGGERDEAPQGLHLSTVLLRS